MSGVARPLRTLFVSYASVPAETGTAVAMIGVLKRCLRLIGDVPANQLHCHVLHFGAVPADPFVRVIRRRVPFHVACGTAGDIGATLDDIRPDVVVLGEGPAAGMMLATGIAAAARAVPQVCVENYYSRAQPRKFLMDTPWLARWVLLGLPLRGHFGALSRRFALAPPLLPAGGFAAPTGSDVVILGYDHRVADAGLRLFGALPRHTTALLIAPPHVLHRVGEPAFGRGRLTVIHAMRESALFARIAAAGAVVCKSGFQQMVEALALGTPVVACEANGSVPEELLAPEMKPYVRYVGVTAPRWRRTVTTTTGWLARRPRMPWTQQIGELRRPRTRAAMELVRAVRQSEAAARGATA